MSNWTHVAAVFRIDTLRFFDTTPDFDKVFGKECLWESPNEIWNDAENNPNDYLPMGSEGSLRKLVWINPNTSSASAYTVTVFGDLRDHDSIGKILEWFQEKCSGLWIRQAVITVENEWYGTKTMTYTKDESE